jgi:hypothetical protein
MCGALVVGGLPVVECDDDRVDCNRGWAFDGAITRHGSHVVRPWTRTCTLIRVLSKVAASSVPSFLSSSMQSQPQSSILITFLVLVILLIILVACLLYRRWNVTYFHDHEPLRLDTHLATTTVERRPKWFRSRITSLDHPASKITPFIPAQSPTWSSASSLVFARLAPCEIFFFNAYISFSFLTLRSSKAHVPGTSMRLATRRDDGVWVFSDPDPASPFSPQGTSELSPSPSSVSRLVRKERIEMQKHLEMLSVPDIFIEPPPPAYTRSQNSPV